MAKPLLLLKNTPREGPGIIENLLDACGIAYEIIEMSASTVPPSMSSFGALVVFGGPESANDESAKMRQEIDFVRQTLAQEKPYLGICLGMQVLVAAAGGTVMRHSTKEIGFRDAQGQFFEVELTEEGRHDPLFRGLPTALKVFQLHGETVDLAPHIRLLATGRLCRNQIVRVNTRAYGIQSHFELNEELLEDWLKEDADLATLRAEDLRRDYREIRPVYQKTGHKIFQNFLSVAGY